MLANRQQLGEILLSISRFHTVHTHVIHTYTHTRTPHTQIISHTHYTSHMFRWEYHPVLKDRSLALDFYFSLSPPLSLSLSVSLFFLSLLLLSLPFFYSLVVLFFFSFCLSCCALFPSHPLSHIHPSVLYCINHDTSIQQVGYGTHTIDMRTALPLFLYFSPSLSIFLLPPPLFLCWDRRG